MYRSCIEGEFQNEATWKMEQESALVLVWLGSKQQFRIPRWESESWNHTAKAVMLCLLRLLRLDLNRRQPCQYPKSIAGGKKPSGLDAPNGVGHERAPAEDVRLRPRVRE